MADLMAGNHRPRTDRWSSVKARTLVLTGGDSPPYQHAAVVSLTVVLRKVE